MSQNDEMMHLDQLFDQSSATWNYPPHVMFMLLFAKIDKWDLVNQCQVNFFYGQRKAISFQNEKCILRDYWMQLKYWKIKKLRLKKD